MANQHGTYSIIDPTKTPYNLRRKIQADDQGHYGFRSLVPPGYAVPEGCATDKFMKLAISRQDQDAFALRSQERYTFLIWNNLSILIKHYSSG